MEFHPHEIKVLKTLTAEMSPQELAERSGLKVDSVVRAASWLSTKKLIELSETTHEIIRLTPEGMFYAEHGLPERQLINLMEIGEEVELDELKARWILWKTSLTK